MTPPTTWTSELQQCPECGGHVEYEQPIESNAEGVAMAVIHCAECPFSATEEWLHHRTVQNHDETETETERDP